MNKKRVLSILLVSLAMLGRPLYSAGPKHRSRTTLQRWYRSLRGSINTLNEWAELSSNRNKVRKIMWVGILAGSMGASHLYNTEEPFNEQVVEFYAAQLLLAQMAAYLLQTYNDQIRHNAILTPALLWFGGKYLLLPLDDALSKQSMNAKTGLGVLAQLTALSMIMQKSINLIRKTRGGRSFLDFDSDGSYGSLGSAFQRERTAVRDSRQQGYGATRSLTPLPTGVLGG